LTLEDQIISAATRRGVELRAHTVAQYAKYLALLAKWNRRINLTALPLEPATGEAIDRLLLEPAIAAKLVKEDDHSMIDLGSGGGSPALPFHVEHPRLLVRMVESRARKCAFLSEAARELGLVNATVTNARFDALIGLVPAASVDIVSMRAVRLDDDLVAIVRHVLKPAGRVFRFTSSEPFDSPSASHTFGLRLDSSHTLFEDQRSRLDVLAQ
jgi:16S rRNA (guanine527-N7)-methyltransferase